MIRIALAMTAVLVLITAGCSTPFEFSPHGASQGWSGRQDGAAASTELASAQRMIQSGDYSSVLPRLERIVDQYSATPAGIEARYFLGLSYYSQKSYREAATFFNEYLKLAPEGDYAASSREYLAGIESDAGITPEKMAAMIADAEGRAAGAPENPSVHLELADLYWRNGDFARGGELYKAIATKWPELANDAAVRTRIEKDASGQWVVLTPEEATRRINEADPLLIHNTSSFRSGRNTGGWSGDLRQQTYNVSGYVTNRGGAPLSNVQVTVNVFGLGIQVYDTKTLGIGQLRPGETRVFRVSFSDFDNIENVNRYECVGNYQR